MYFDDDTGKEVSCPDEYAGLYVLPRYQTEPIRVTIPSHINPKCCALYQIGETSQILSNGILCATPHAVMMPQKQQRRNDPTKNNNSSNNVTRESFAVFMEPEFHTILSSHTTDLLDKRMNETNITTSQSDETNDILLRLPSLQKRYQAGQTFGDFHLATVSSFATTN
jgi:hypothetical protein